MSALRWALLGAAWGAVGPALHSGLRAPEVDPSRFFIDYAYLRRDYPCSPEERRCFDYGRLLHPSDGRCYRVGERGPCAEGQLFHADRAEAFAGGGFHGSCASHCPDTLHVRLAASGDCVSLADLHHTVCRAELGLRGALDAFGEAVCTVWRRRAPRRSTRAWRGDACWLTAPATLCARAGRARRPSGWCWTRWRCWGRRTRPPRRAAPSSRASSPSACPGRARAGGWRWRPTAAATRCASCAPCCAPARCCSTTCSASWRAPPRPPPPSRQNCPPAAPPTVDALWTATPRGPRRSTCCAPRTTPSSVRPLKSQYAALNMKYEQCFYSCIIIITK